MLKILHALKCVVFKNLDIKKFIGQFGARIYKFNQLSIIMKYQFLEHTADIKFRLYGKTLNEIFENAVLAISEYISRGQKIKPSKGKVIDVSGIDYESLFYSFLDEIIYLLDAENFLVVKAKVTIRGYNLQAELFGDKASNYKDLDHIKAATYAEMYIKKTEDGFEAQAVLDV